MRLSPTTLLGNSLVFDRTGQTLIAVEPDAISIVELGADGQTTRLPIRDARVVAAFADQLWIATHDDQLARIDHAGRALRAAHSIPFSARAVLQPAPYGPAAAVWLSNPALALIDDLGQLAATELVDVDIAFPLTGRRFITARGSELTLPSGLVTTLPPKTTALSGAVMADGKSVTLLVAHAGAHQLIGVSLGTGQITQRCPTPSSTVRIATRRSFAITQLEPRMLRVLDLHAGRELGVIRFDHDVDDFAIDPSGCRLAVRSDTGAIELHHFGELLRRSVASIQTASVAESVDEKADGQTAVEDSCERRSACAPSEVRETASRAFAPDIVVTDIRTGWKISTEALESATRAGNKGGDLSAQPVPAELCTPVVCPALSALAPRISPIEIDIIEARHQLGRELRTVALWTLGAIAAAWDSRKLGYGNEGKHPCELEVGAILGMNRGLAGGYLIAAHEQIADHEHAIAIDLRWRSLDTPVGAMTHELGLDPLAVDIVLMIAAGTLSGEIARLYGILANDAGRAIVDELLVQQVLAPRYDRHSVAAALDPRGLLMRLGIVHVAPKRARPFARLTVDQVVLDRLRAVEPDLGPATTVRTTDRDLASLGIPRGVLESAVAALARPLSSADHSLSAARVAVHGRVGSGRCTLSCALAARAGRDVAVIDALTLPRTPDLCDGSGLS